MRPLFKGAEIFDDVETMHQTEPSLLLRPKQVINLLQVSRSTFYRWLDKKYFPRGEWFPGTRIRVWRREVVVAWIRDHLR